MTTKTLYSSEDLPLPSLIAFLCTWHVMKNAAEVELDDETFLK